MEKKYRLYPSDLRCLAKKIGQWCIDNEFDWFSIWTDGTEFRPVDFELKEFPKTARERMGDRKCYPPMEIRCDGELCDVMDGYLPSSQEEFDAMLEERGLYSECEAGGVYGIWPDFDWDLAHPACFAKGVEIVEPDDLGLSRGARTDLEGILEDVFRAAVSVDGKIRADRDALVAVRDLWYVLSSRAGDDGSCVLGAKLTFKLEGKPYRMRAQSPSVRSLSWERPLGAIEKALEALGCEEIRYDCGRMD